MTKATRSLIASEKGIERARKALIDLGINQTGLEERLGISRSTISSFFNRTKPVDHTNFTTICKALKIEWHEIIDESTDIKTKIYRTESHTDQNAQTKMPRLAFVIEGSVSSDEVKRAKLQAIVKQLQKITGDASIEIIDIQEGSIKLILSGKLGALAMIQEIYELGTLTEIEEIPIIRVSFESLIGADLIGANLIGANLSKTDLSRANLSKAKLFGANLSEANLSEANLSGANLSGANLSGANLSRANLSGANLSGANLSGANLSRANLSGAEIFSAYLRKANLSNADLKEANLKEANLKEANLKEANFFIANLSNVNFKDANLRDSNLSGVDLIGADLSNVNFFNANLFSADLSRANLSGSDLNKADVESARFADNLGISEALKLDLIDRGAIFDDSRGDRSRELTPV